MSEKSGPVTAMRSASSSGNCPQLLFPCQFQHALAQHAVLALTAFVEHHSVVIIYAYHYNHIPSPFWLLSFHFANSPDLFFSWYQHLVAVQEIPTMYHNMIFRCLQVIFRFTAVLFRVTQ